MQYNSIQLNFLPDAGQVTSFFLMENIDLKQRYIYQLNVLQNPDTFLKQKIRNKIFREIVSFARSDF